MATRFQQTSTTQIVNSGFTFGVYDWSTSANWTNGIPGTGAAVTVNTTIPGNPSSYDDIAALSIDTLNLTNAAIAVAGSLNVGMVVFGTNSAQIYSDTLLGAASATLVVDGFSGASNGRIAAIGTHALTEVLSANDPGEIYQVDSGGELVLAPAPHTAAGAPGLAGFYYQNSGGTTGTFAFETASGTISALLSGVAIGDSIALPGSDVSSVTYGASSMTVVTNLGTIVFSDVGYSGTTPSGFITSTDAATGLQRINFTSQQSTSFQQTATSQVINSGFTFGVYDWSTSANWTNGVPGTGAAVTVNTTIPGNPSSYDDIAALSIDTLNLTNGAIAVAGSLNVGMVVFGTNSAQIYSDTLLGAASATLVVDGFSGASNGRIAAIGTHALTEVLSGNDPGEIYQVDSGGELVLAPAPHTAAGAPGLAGFYYQNSGGTTGTFAFETASGTISALLSGVAIGDSIALPGSDVSSVTYGASSMTVVTNLGTIVFSDVGYSGTTPSGFTTSTDAATGLQRITFTSQQSTSFQQTSTTQIVNSGFTFGVYDWSNAVNWTNGIPGTGAAVTVNTTIPGNPSSYDDIAALSIDTLNLTNGAIAVAGSLNVGMVVFGTNSAQIYSDTLLGAASATLVVDGFSGASNGRIAAIGTHALTEVLSGNDPGEIYQVDSGGELVLAPAPHTAAGAPGLAGFYYQNSGGTTGTFAFETASGTISALLSGVAIGDSIALPGSDVSSVTYGASSMTVVTNLGTIVFSDVGYSGTTPSGFTTSTDAATGLQRITFTSQQSTSFQQTSTTQIVNSGFTFGVYDWSNAVNWTNGIPGTGAAVTVNTTIPGNPSSYDDIAALSIDTLNLTNGAIAVAGSLNVGMVVFGTNSAQIYSDTLLGAASATLVVDGFSGASNGRIAAIGTHALTEVLSANDPGEIYQVDSGGELVLAPAPHTAAGAPGLAGFYYQNSGGTTGTFAFKTASGTISALLSNAAIGDSIALPGSDVSSVTYGTSSMTVVTNLGTIVFSDVGYAANETLTGFTTSTDAATGLQRITFTGDVNTTFQQTATTQIINSGFTFGVYEWSNAANWTNGVPTTSAAVTVNTTIPGNPSSYDDIAALSIDTLNLTNGAIAVAGSLNVGTVVFGTNSAQIYSDTLLGAASATLVVDGFSGTSNGRIAAIGTHALTEVLSANDPGEIYQVDSGGELVLAPAPYTAAGAPGLAGFYYQNSGGTTGTFAFETASGTISALLSNAAIGDSIALPGTSVSSVTYGASSMTVATNLGTVVFSNVGYAANQVLTGFTAAADPISGLERVTFGGYANTTFQRVTTGIAGQYYWSNSSNWTNGIPTNSSGVIFNAAVPNNPAGIDDIASLTLANLSLQQGDLGVSGALTLNALTMSAGALIEADTLLSHGTAAVVINRLSGAGGFIESVGTNAVTTVQAATDPGENYYVGSHGTIVVATPVNSTSQFNLGFSAADTGTIGFANQGSIIAAALTNIAIGDAIELPGSSVSSVTYGANTLTVVTSAGTTTFSNAHYQAASMPNSFTASADASTGLQEITFTSVCFCAGTLIRTPNGDVSVERLTAGDTVITASGVARPITWIGTGRVLATRGRRNAATPVIVRKGALGDNVPNRDLHVTKGHSLYLDGVLIPVEFLVNHRSILWDDHAQEVSIYHIELATHDVLIANGAAAESYRDDGNRWLFRNANPAWEAEPEQPCAPLLTGGELVDKLWWRLLNRAGPRPGLPLTDDPGLHLQVDGRRLLPEQQSPTSYAFHLPARPCSVRLVSRAGSPQELGIGRDPRSLGVAVGQLVLAAPHWTRSLAADDARLVDGYHNFESGPDLRWTNGDAVIPSELFDGMTGPARLLVHLGCQTRYPDLGEFQQVA